MAEPQRPNPFRKFTKPYDLEQRRREIEVNHPRRLEVFSRKSLRCSAPYISGSVGNREPRSWRLSSIP
jgi:hypothetical protein